MTFDPYFTTVEGDRHAATAHSTVLIDMEHLVYCADDANELRFVYESDVLYGRWDEENSLPGFVDSPQRTIWQGFDHDAIPKCRFESYPRMAGFVTGPLWNGNLRDSHPDLQKATNAQVSKKVAAFLQAWFYYGLLSSVVAKKICVSYLMREVSHGQGYLYSLKLQFCLQWMTFRLRKSADTEAASVDVQRQLLQVKTWMQHITTWSHSNFRQKLDAEWPCFMDSFEATMPAIIRLAESIEQARLFALPYCTTLGTLSWLLPFTQAEKRRNMLRQLGWCNFQLKMLGDAVNYSTIDWLFAVGKRQDAQGHETCTTEACNRNDIDESVYQQAHVCADKNCLKVIPDTTKILEALEQDKISVVLFRAPAMNFDSSSPVCQRTNLGRISRYLMFGPTDSEVKPKQA
ncbi:hypothetical protein EJ03DRAFT_37607 [Teratosphaeria nubilosa]|uniref:Uncharacterized protein n=1 Tax=Teratosphaeria nubilosa TaxID=161662 RepID=A0A6G1LF88_9PEZI|nr:hypothetical protein EJ03DRAFT_37607 [Teratosphaeria nubilosa]